MCRSMVLSAASEVPGAVVLPEGSSHPMRMRVRLMSEYGRFRRADLEAHLPLRLGARFVRPVAGLALEAGEDPEARQSAGLARPADGRPDEHLTGVCGSIDGSGRGMVHIVLRRTSASLDLRDLEIELFVLGPAAAQVLSVLTPKISISAVRPTGLCALTTGPAVPLQPQEWGGCRPALPPTGNAATKMVPELGRGIC